MIFITSHWGTGLWEVNFLSYYGFNNARIIILYWDLNHWGHKESDFNLYLIHKNHESYARKLVKLYKKCSFLQLSVIGCYTAT